MKHLNATRFVALAAASAAAGALVLPGLAAGNARSTNGTTVSTSSSGAFTAQRTHVAMMTGAQEVPAADPDGTGRATITADPTTGEVCWDIQVANITLPATAAHIHGPAAPGATAPPVVTLTAPDATGRASGCTTATPTEAQAVLANPGNFYVNVHTTDFPNGAVRGQLQAGLNPAGQFYALPSPLRAYDSRLVTSTGGGTTSTSTGTTGSKLSTNEVRTIDLSMGRDPSNAMAGAVPAGATAAQITLTITETDATGGFVTAYSAALANRPQTSSINWKTANTDIATTLVVAVDASGMIKLSGFGSTHVIVDVLGYYF